MIRKMRHDRDRPLAVGRDSLLWSRLVLAQRKGFMFRIFKKVPPPSPPSPPEEDPADPLCLVIVPALVAILLNAEQEKGSPLTEAEVIGIRDNAQCIAMPASAAAAVEAERGYPDIEAEAAWTEWQRVRLELGQSQ